MENASSSFPTQYNRRFHIFRAGPASVWRKAGEHGSTQAAKTKSDLPRYYYSAYDHGNQPSLERAMAREILFRFQIAGPHSRPRGGFWR